MTTIYGMSTCPDCTYVEEQVKGDSRYLVRCIKLHHQKTNQKLYFKEKGHS